MKKYSHIELIEKARYCFKLTEADIVYATEDGYCFLHKNYADNHNRTIKGKVIKFNKNQIIKIK